MSDIERVAHLAWAAGIVDGEGSIRIQSGATAKAGWAVILSVWNTDPRMLTKLREIAGSGTILPRRTKRNAEWRPIFEWRLTNRSAVEFLHQLVPFLVIKKEEAGIALELAALPKIMAGHRLSVETVDRRETLRQQLAALRQSRPTLELAG